jgi:hypothetical protein
MRKPGYSRLSPEEKLEYHREASRRTGDKRQAMGLTRRGKARAPKKDWSIKACLGCKRVLPRTADYFYLSEKGKWSAQCNLCRKANHDSVLRPVVAAEYEEILDGSVCGICETPDNLMVDYCHRTGHPRGVLCIRCNAVLGHMGENILRFQRAIDYLKRHSEDPLFQLLGRTVPGR